MTEIIKKVSKTLFIKAVTHLPEDVLHFLKKAYTKETNKIARENLSLMIKNAELAKRKNMIICQDTGLPTYFVFLGEKFPLSVFKIKEAIRDGCRLATEEFPLRPNVVDPISRKNTLTNTGEKIPVINIEFVENSDIFRIIMMPKGAGSENMSQVRFLPPSDGIEGIKKFVLDTIVSAGGNPCPPLVVGVGIGGNLELCTKLAKYSLLRKLGKYNRIPEIKSLEKELLSLINKTGIGPMGLGGKTTALWVSIETGDTHIAMLPIAVNVQCWVHRKAEAIITRDGDVKQ